MFWCHSCSNNTLISNNILACMNCGSEAIEEISHSSQPNNYIPYQINNTQRIQSDPLQQIRMMMGLGHIFPFDLMMQNRVGPMVIRYTIISEIPQEEQKNPVSEQFIQKLPKIQVDQCPVCQESGGNGLKLPCNHIFHDNCIKPWFKEKNSCPCCRKTFSN